VDLSDCGSCMVNGRFLPIIPFHGSCLVRFIDASNELKVGRSFMYYSQVHFDAQFTLARTSDARSPIASERVCVFGRATITSAATIR
jgi:hypothetical protein